MIFIYKKNTVVLTSHTILLTGSAANAVMLSSMAFEIVPIRGIVQLCMVGLYADIGSK